MAKNYKYVPEYKRYDTVLATLAQAHNMIVGCHDQLLELGVDQNTMDTLAFALRCLKTGLDKRELNKIMKEKEWNEFASQFKIVTFEEEPKEASNV